MKISGRRIFYGVQADAGSCGTQLHPVAWPPGMMKEYAINKRYSMRSERRQEWMLYQRIQDSIVFGKLLCGWVLFIVFAWALLYTCIAGAGFLQMLWIVVSHWKF
ncbi:MAG: hypothetical protein PHD76_05355 [Methylacidiphilales bacterium]|nr:hypothetical protein [Candidatus Methylacidiphilales bacterium]